MDAIRKNSLNKRGSDQPHHHYKINSALRIFYAGNWPLLFIKSYFPDKKACTAATVAAGSSSCGTWPSFPNITSLEPLISFANSCALDGGVRRSCLRDLRNALQSKARQSVFRDRRKQRNLRRLKRHRHINRLKVIARRTNRKFDHMRRSMAWIFWAKAPLIAHV